MSTHTLKGLLRRGLHAGLMSGRKGRQFAQEDRGTGLGQGPPFKSIRRCPAFPESEGEHSTERLGPDGRTSRRTHDPNPIIRNAPGLEVLGRVGRRAGGVER
jgi:hypothetical protein